MAQFAWLRIVIVPGRCSRHGGGVILPPPP